MKIVFMGTPDFAVPSLEKINESSSLEILGVVTQPDRPRDRGQKLRPTPVKATALKMGIEVFETSNVNKEPFLNKLRALQPEAIVVVAFGQKLGNEILDLPVYGCINLHASLLPEYRGASPIHQVIIDGKKLTGVTTMYMDEGWDTGDIIYKEEVEIADKETVGELHDRLASIGAKLLVKTLIDIEKGTAPREAQDDELATYAGKIDKDTGKIDWGKSARDIFNLIRGVNPWPGAYTYYHGDLIKIWKAEMLEDINFPGSDKPGRIVSAGEEDGLVVKTGKGYLRINELQLAGRRKMSVKEFLRGYNINTDEYFD
jgi:methionyl-tRNA formyltransferase